MCKVYVRYILVFLFGPGRNRTTDTRIFNPLPHSTKPQGLIHLTILRRVKRHFLTNQNHLHGSPAKTRPALVICAHRPNTREAKPTQGPKLDSKVLAIEPNRF